MKYGSVCSGVEAATVAWHPLGWEPQWLSEIEKFPSAVLQHHYPNTPNLGDMTKFKEWNDDPIDLLVGGTPCQSFSVAGLRKGLDDPRGNLMLTYVAIAARYKPRWLVWENVPGVLSSNGGRDFGTFLTALGEIGYGFAYRICDAQYFGVAQRRRRVFVVGYLGDWRRAAAVLFERDSLSGHPAPSRETRQEAAGYTSSSFGKYSEGVGTVRASGGDLGGGFETLVAKNLTKSTRTSYSVRDDVTPKTAKEIVGTLSARDYKGAQAVVSTITAPYGMGGVDYETKPLVFGAQNSASQGDSVSEHVSPTLDKSKTPAVAFSAGQSSQAGSLGLRVEQSPTLRGGASGTNMTPTLLQNMQVRRLLPIECERLQGFPDNYTQIPWRNKAPEDCPDGPRYKAMGNSMAVPVMNWIGRRIQMVEDITNG